MSEKVSKLDLQERLIDYSVRIINVSEQLPETKAGKHISFSNYKKQYIACPKIRRSS